jgi:hypothetical protein
MLFFRKMVPTNVRRAIAMTVLCCGMLWTKPSAAIENLKLVRGILILEGKIKKGDYIKVREFLSNASNFEKMNGEVFLASPGGNIFEALQIGYLIRHLRLSTDAPSVPSRPPPIVRDSDSEAIRPFELTNPKYYQCASACFLLYVSGIHREFIWAGRLGIHPPQLRYKPVGTTKKNLSVAMADVRSMLKIYFEQMNVPRKYLDLIFSLQQNKVHWITQGEFNADLNGYIPEVRALLAAKCNTNTDSARSKEMRRCIARVKETLRLEAWRKIFSS